MIAIVTDSGDFDVAITFKELENWDQKSPIEGELLRVYEIPCGKKIRIILEPMAEKLVDYRLDSDDWDHARIVELVCNQRALEKLNSGSDYLLHTEIGTVNVLIQVDDVLGCHHG